MLWFDAEIERPPYPWNMKLPRHSRYRSKNRRQQVGVFVGVEMAGLNPCPDNLPHLRDSFFVRVELPPNERSNQLPNRSRQFPVRIGH